MALPALAVKHPKFGDAYLGGKEHAQRTEMNALGMETRKLQNKGIERQQALDALKFMGNIATTAMNGQMEGEVDPQRWEEGLKRAKEMGYDTSQLEGNPQLAPGLARNSLTTYQQIGLENDRKKWTQHLKEYDNKIKGIGTETPKYTAPVKAYDENGKLIFVQPSNTGNSQVMEGFTPAPSTKKIETGTETIIINNITGEEISRTPTQTREKARETEIGKVEGKTEAEYSRDLPKIRDTSRYMTSAIDEVLNTPNLKSFVGNVQGRLYEGLSQERQDFNNALKHVKSQQFAIAFESLKGAGQITEYESRSAAEAQAVLETTSSDQQFIKALKTLQGIVNDLSSRAAKLANPRLSQKPTVIEIPNPGEKPQQDNNRDPLGLGIK